MEPISIKEIIERAASATSALFEPKPYKLKMEVESDLPDVLADRDRLIQVVINLISNAVKFTDRGGVTCRAYRDDGSIQVSVIDSGAGIKEEDYLKVFEQFVQVGDTLTNKPMGTGLGLPICKQIIEHHGGKIWVESQPGKGSTSPLRCLSRPSSRAPKKLSEEFYGAAHRCQRPGDATPRASCLPPIPSSTAKDDPGRRRRPASASFCAKSWRARACARGAG
jgi:signal transduction histidine kinase